MSTDKVILDWINQQIVVITLNRPDKLNVMDQEMMAAFGHILDQIEKQPGIRVLILKASGERAFCAGADIKDFSRLTPRQMWQFWINKGNALFDRLASLHFPTISVIKAPALGGGFELALCTDIRLCTPSAGFALPEAGIGTIPGWSGMRRVAKLSSPALAKYLALTGIRLDSAAALQRGIVSEVVENGQIDSRALELAKTIADRSPLAVTLCKALIDEEASEEPGYAIQGMASALSAMSDDGQEGLLAFMEKRPPGFKGW